MRRLAFSSNLGVSLRIFIGTLGREFYTTDRIIKTSFKTLKISGENMPRDWTIQPIEIVSGHCFSHDHVCSQLFQHFFLL